uniref:Uncharacterized protein n=1 Tax=Acrobeloides nanus TaxID=290746 RepID=A0A914CFM3_9BILA
MFSTGVSITVYNNLGSQRTKYGTILSFAISSKSEMHCFYENFGKDARLRIKVTGVNAQSPELHMRLTSPSMEFSEWFHNRDELMYHGKAEEEGVS